MPHRDVLTLVERRELFGADLGWVEAHLLAAALLNNTRLWTLDRCVWGNPRACSP